MKKIGLIAGVLASTALFSSAWGQAKYGPGTSATEIRIGNTVPYSGPASAVGAIGKALDGYFAMVNESGGVNGRKIKFISLDDAYSPAKAVEQTRRLVESDDVSFMLANTATANISATQKYLTIKKVPTLFVVSSASKWNDPEHFPWTMALPWQPPYGDEAKIYLDYLRSKKPAARIAILYQNDDAGKEYLKATRESLGTAADDVIAGAASFEVLDPTVDSQILTLRATGADALMIYGVTPKACSQALRKLHEINWQPIRFIASSCANPDAVLKPAGLDAADGIMTIMAFKFPVAGEADDAAVSEYKKFMNKYVPGANPYDTFNVYAYSLGQVTIDLLQRAGDDLTRENIMHTAATMHDVKLPLLLPGISLNTTATDYRPLRDGYMAEFKNGRWNVSGTLIRSK
ncbi:ABC transporter substrate-binding protein [Bradyrhizobium sp. CCGUVB14]|uniref:ABC transporter substrate-binding protein n=1 Tax=Bradyrhizobium sp. CCGUVB14 TaxID=2949628 RepID=UPI0020B39CBD|nr:ABC transporter substrate-binding protein [Bradyrhizobium sp. CCGUVB14]MCP3446051.1 ABC transporter substrate-binding protein [Bradyrhizobium sp. CCGUVB14]